MSKSKTAGLPRQDQARVTAAEWFAGGQRIWYDPGSARALTEKEAAAAPGTLRVFERVAAGGPGPDEDAVWLTLLPGFPDGSYGWAQVDRLLGDRPRPRLYVEPVGQGDSDKPRDYRYSTIERADLVQALWRHHRVRATVVVTIDYTSLALLELLRRQLDRPASGDTATPVITAAFMMNGGLFADRHTHPWRGTPLLRSPLGALAMRGWQRSDEDPYEHRQIPAARQRVPQAEILTFPGGHLTTGEHPDLLAAAIRDIAERHGAGTPATASR
jgi:pimeloyl-ACP methyl ester carboxylesterase